eukprot:1531229-Prorocentrum_lima.AAC.1
MNSIAGEQVMVRFHSDAGSEFWKKEVAELLNENLIMQTKASGYEPKANGRPERYIGILKRKSNI